MDVEAIYLTGTWDGQPGSVLLTGTGPSATWPELEAALITLVRSGSPVRDGPPPSSLRAPDPRSPRDWALVLENLHRWSTESTRPSLPQQPGDDDEAVY